MELVAFPNNSTCELFAQEVKFGPAVTVGTGDILIVISSVTAVQFPLPVVERVRVTEPEAISADVGV